MSKYGPAILSMVLLQLAVIEPTGAQVGKAEANPAELAILPQYCQDRLTRNRDRMQHWHRLFGRENAIHIHHHCYGLLFLNRANAVVGDDTKRRRMLQRAAKESNYVLSRWSQNFPLYQEALNNKLQAEALLNR